MTPARLRALVRLLVDSGDLTPAGSRLLLRNVAEDELDEGGVGDE